MSMSNISIVIPNWNGDKLISDCLKSLEKQTLPVNIIVVDNGSTDNSIPLIEKDFPGVQLIKLGINKGFAGGVNVGIKESIDKGYEYIALFNNDAIADSHWVEKLVKTAKNHPKAGIVTGKLMALDKKHFDSTGEFFHIWGVPSPRGRLEVDKGQYNQPSSVFGATGGASLYKASLFKDIGFFDESFFMYYEDTDISFRAQLAGWTVYYNPKAVAYHYIGASTEKVKGLHAYNTLKNQPLLILKNVPIKMLCGFLLRFCLIYTLTFLVMVRSGNFLPALHGVISSVLITPHALVERHKIQSKRKVSDSYIRSIMSSNLPPGMNKIDLLIKRLGFNNV